MQKIKIIVDSASDIPDQALRKYGIEMVGLQLMVDGREYVEREDISIQEFYAILEKAKELPVTSRVPMGKFVDAYARAFADGCTDIIVITINAGGSGTYESAYMAKDLFLADKPNAAERISIHLVDSGTFSLAFGYPAIQAAAMAQRGKTVEEILHYLEDFFSRAEIYLACFTLEYAKKSGRITAAAAFVGDVLGMRPIIAMVDGTTKIAAKVRGDKNVVRKLADIYRERRISPDSPIITASAAVDQYGLELQSLLEGELGREVPHYKVGAAITINAGPRIAALCFLGPKRKRHTRHTLESTKPSPLHKN